MPAPWCGKVGAGAIVAATLNPCIFNTAASLLLALAAAAAALLQGSAARRLSAAAAGRPYLLPRPGAAVAHAQVAAAGVLLALHGFALVWATSQVPQPPYVVFSEALLLTAWSMFMVGQLIDCCGWWMWIGGCGSGLAGTLRHVHMHAGRSTVLAGAGALRAPGMPACTPRARPAPRLPACPPAGPAVLLPPPGRDAAPEGAAVGRRRSVHVWAVQRGTGCGLWRGCVDWLGRWEIACLPACVEVLPLRCLPARRRACLRARAHGADRVVVCPAATCPACPGCCGVCRCSSMCMASAWILPSGASA